MKKYIYVLTAAAAFLFTNAQAQEEGGKTKEPHKRSREVIIREKPGDKGKTTVVIDENGNVTVNGKPASDWEGGKITVLPDDMDRHMFELQRKLDDDQGRQFKVLMDRFYVDGKGARLGVYSAENEKGAQITEVTDSSAAFNAGLKKGDIITKVGDSPISSPEALSKVIHEHQPGETITVHYLRDDKAEETKVTLQKQKEFQFHSLAMSPEMKLNFKTWPGWNPRPRLGANIQDMEDNSGVKVLHVNPESPAAKAGLQKDDIITSIDGKPVKGVDQALDVLSDATDKNNYPLTVNRGGTTVTLQVKIPRDLKSATL